MKKHKHNTEKIVIKLKKLETKVLNKIVKSGKNNARVISRARILLLSSKGKKNKEIIEALDCGERNICNVRQRYKERGSIKEAISDAPRSGQPKFVTPEHEAFVIATSCTKSPEGHNHWTTEALKEQLLKTYKKLDSISDERVRQILVRAEIKPWREKNVVCSVSHAGVSGTDG